ncbi:hypothetical protein EI427_08195 [Flammeovirga pectinis]|uniref:Uncharacterized protein n=1 Tax=Flammeovirga pectinis TaxID=2494373 RepID=A0A3Q9FQI6_9BACT|nr:hypothetical protein [Flammeovirga pectinis]AZQ62217.1 hypothetical protein EI427_08195 [Flammeovirga pectinis]
MTSNFNTPSFIKEDVQLSLCSNLKRTLGKSILLQAGVRTKNIELLKDYKFIGSDITLDVIMHSNNPSINIVIGFMIVDKESYQTVVPKLKGAMKFCNKFYIVTDLKERDKLYDLLDLHDLNSIGVVGRMSDHQFVTCKVAVDNKVEPNIYYEFFSNKKSVKNDRKPLDETNRYISFHQSIK